MAAKALLVLTLTIVSLLVACGGEDGDAGDSTPTATATASRTASPAASPTRAPTPPPPEVQLPVQEFPNQGQAHLDLEETHHDYNSNPPTSGPHSPVAAPWGVYREPVPREVLVHNMEHGGVVVWHNCSAGDQPLSSAECTELVNNLGGIVAGYVRSGRNVIMSPYDEMDQRIALTAWTKLVHLDDFDEAMVRAFIEEYERAFNPEGF